MPAGGEDAQAELHEALRQGRLCLLVDAINVEAIESRNAGYAIGFFLFWANGWIAGWYTLRLVRRKRRGPGATVP